MNTELRPETQEMAKRLEERDPDLVIYAMGALSMSVCSRLSPEETVARVNEKMCGITTWGLDPAPTFSGGQPNPCPCERDETRTHYLLG